MNQWFKTRVLPELYYDGQGSFKSEPVLVQCKNNRRTVAYVLKYQDSFMVFWLDAGSEGRDLTDQVLYWSELPKLCTPEDVIG